MLISQTALKALTTIRKRNGGALTAILIYRGRCYRITDMPKIDRMLEDGATLVGRYDGTISLARLQADLQAALSEIEVSYE